MQSLLKRNELYLPFVVRHRRLDTTAGVIDILIRHDWAPHGARSPSAERIVAQIRNEGG